MFKCIQDNETVCRENTAFSLLKWYVTLFSVLKTLGQRRHKSQKIFTNKGNLS